MTERRRRKVFSHWNVRCFDKHGRLKWEELDRPNILHDEGEQFILEAVFSEVQSVPANYYIGLDNRGSLAEADSMPVTGEPSGSGYAREAVASDNTDFPVSLNGDYQAETKTVTFTASGGTIGPVLNMFLATTVDDSGKLVASVALSASRTLQDGDSLQTDLYIKLSE